MPVLDRTVGAALVVLALAGPASAQPAPEWMKYTDPVYGFSADLPVGLFEPLPEQEGAAGLTLVETGGSGQLSLYGGSANGLTLDVFAQQLSASDNARNITYRAGGNSWFVLSGYLEEGAEPLVFYTKVLFSPDRRTFSAFEISYPQAEKRRFDPLVSRLEDAFTRPPSL